MSVGQRFKEIREELGYSQPVFAEKLETNQSGISDIETGRKMPNETIMEFLHDNFYINLNWLICNSGKKKLNEYKENDAIAKVAEPYGENVYKELAEARGEIIKLKNENIKLKECCKLQEEKDKAKA